MIELFRKLFIAEFDGNGKTRWSFFWYQIVIIVAILVLIGFIFGIDKILRGVEIYFYPHCGKYCNEKEIFYGGIIEITNNILFLFSLLFLFKFNSGVIERFSYLRFSGFVEKILKIILTTLTLIIVSVIIIFSSNFVLYFSGENLFFIYEILNFSKKEITLFLLGIIFVEFFMFFLGMILWRKK